MDVFSVESPQPRHVGGLTCLAELVRNAELIFLHMVLLSFDLNLGTGQFLIYKSVYRTHIFTLTHSHALSPES